MHQTGDVVGPGDEALGVQEAQRQVEVVARGPHRHGEGSPVDPDLHRLLDGDGVGALHNPRSQRVADIDAHDRHPLRHPSHTPHCRSVGETVC